MDIEVMESASMTESAVMYDLQSYICPRLDCQALH